jgi:hypothetical protein
MSNEGLMIYEDIQNETLRLFLDKLDEEYGSILTNVGGTAGLDGGKWISPKTITVLVHKLDKELRESTDLSQNEYARLKNKYFKQNEVN